MKRPDRHGSISIGAGLLDRSPSFIERLSTGIVEGVAVAPFSALPTLLELQPGDATAGLYGGKAAGLARLVAEGLAVPEGFAVPTTTDTPPSWSPERLRAFEEAVQPLLAAGPVAVRSSALGEDSAERSFAGLFETSLNLTTGKATWEAVTRGIAAGASRRVLSYAGREQPLPVGLVVQRMVPSAQAGVLFTRDPEGRQPGVFIEAVAGLGESLVSGRKNPEQWRVHRSGLGHDEAHRTPGGPDVLLPGAPVRLARVARKLAHDWGQALDLEWAIDEQGKTWWLQARPITTGHEWRPPRVQRSVPEPDEGPITVWSNFNTRESLPDPLTPFTWSLWRDTILKAITRDVQGVPPHFPHADQAIGLDLVGGRVYFNLNALLGSPAIGSRLPALLKLLDPRAAAVAEQLIDDKVLQPRQLGGRMWKLRCLLTVALGAGGRLLPALRPRKALAAMEEVGEAIRQRPPVAGLTDDELLAELRGMENPANLPLTRGLALATIGMFVFLAGDRLFRPWPRARSLLCAGAEGNPTTAMSIGIDRLVEAAGPIAEQLDGHEPVDMLLAALRADDSPPVVAWLAELDRFLHACGHRTPGELDLAVPRWADDPSMVLELVRKGLSSPAPETVDERLGRLRGERDQVLSEVIAQAPLWKRALLRWARRAVPVWMPLREAPKHYTLMVLYRIRKAAVECGRRLVQRGLIVRPDDVFLLETSEVEALVRGEQSPVPPVVRVARRRHQVAANAARPALEFVRSDGVPVRQDEAAEQEEGGALRGVGIGGGRAHGPVRLLDSPDPRRVEAGDVLVLRFADPAWTPLFPRASAVVMEVGGAMCHAAVIARELGIPAVFGVRDARARLSDVHRVDVDGDEGVVRPEIRASGPPMSL